MQQLENKYIVEHIVRAAIDVISRRTSEGYGLIVINSIVVRMSDKYNLFKFVKIKGTKYVEVIDVLSIDDKINYVNEKEIGDGIKELIENITTTMGRDAGYFFIKEVKEELSYPIEKRLNDLDVDLNDMQLKYIAEKRTYGFDVKNADLLKYVIKALFNILDNEKGRNDAYTKMADIVERFSTEYEVLKYIRMNDIRSMSSGDTVSIMPGVNDIESRVVGDVLQKIIQEVSSSLREKGRSEFVEKINNSLDKNYIFKMEEIGVDLHVVELKQELVVKHMIKALIDVLSEISSPSYAILTIDGAIKKIGEDYEPLKYIKINSANYSDGWDAVSISPEIEGVRISELGEGIQKMIEKLILNLDEETGEQFLDKFKDHLGKAYLLRIEEMGINLHMVESKQNLLW